MSRLFETPSEKPPENLTAREVAGDPATPVPEFSLEQRRTLLRIAHEAILSVLEQRALSGSAAFITRAVGSTRRVHNSLSARRPFR